jgi:hypothetical protein
MIVTSGSEKIEPIEKGESKKQKTSKAAGGFSNSSAVPPHGTEPHPPPPNPPDISLPVP